MKAALCPAVSINLVKPYPVVALNPLKPFFFAAAQIVKLLCSTLVHPFFSYVTQFQGLLVKNVEYVISD